MTSLHEKIDRALPDKCADSVNAVMGAGALINNIYDVLDTLPGIRACRMSIADFLVEYDERGILRKLREHNYTVTVSIDEGYPKIDMESKPVEGVIMGGQMVQSRGGRSYRRMD